MSLLGTQQPIMTILLLYSFLSYKYDSRSRKIKADKKYLFVSIFMGFFVQGVYISISTKSLSGFNSYADSGSEVSMMVMIVEQWALEIGLAIIFFNGIIMRKKQIKFLKSLLMMEKEIDRLKYGFNKEKTYRSFKSTLFGKIALVVAAFFSISEFFIST